MKKGARCKGGIKTLLAWERIAQGQIALYNFL